ncbi:signal peptidase II [Roseomonas indoligenes]|uniref:Lipoprotein signal peptidase n=1 Tax=Roseomonas indoligenes TaxID=2820811 RepID=A0A940S9Z3_9PROT|nr:signal peptidase II [Pararoseomonas indoligenes]MBP0495793.1 signal peptidase II [Pararoseomonas indoligenes]
MTGTEVSTTAGRATLLIGSGLAAATVLALDQATKAWALSALWPPHVPHPVTPFLNWRLGFNTGATFGMFSSGSASGVWLLIGVAVAVTAWLLAWMWRTRSRLEATSLGMVIGGAVGNVVDRLRRGAVTDFIDAHYAGWHWPTFNVADIGIVCGVVLLLAGSFRPERKAAATTGADA